MKIEITENEAIIDGKKYVLEPRPEPAHDPYLTPGQPCEVSGDDHTHIHVEYFSRSIDGKNYFVALKDNIGNPEEEFTFPIYRPIGTVWDFLPDWAEWIAMDGDGDWFGYETNPLKNGDSWLPNGGPCEKIIKPPFTYTGDWKDSLHRRPEWARRKA